jgi:hypothetical protein
MALTSNGLTSYTVGSSGGNREDLGDVLYRVENEETPILASIGTSTAEAVYHEWMNDDLAAVDASNAALEGDDVAPVASTVPTRLGNYAQIFRKSWAVTGTQERVRKAGRASEVARLKVNRAIECRRDMERILFGEQGQVAGDATTARKARGLESWLSTNVDRGATGADAASATAAPTDGTQRAFTEAQLKTVLQSMFDEGARPKKAFVGGYNKQAFSGFTGRSNARQMVSENVVHASVDIYASDFGNLEVHPSAHHRGRTALLIDPEYLSVAFLRPMQNVDLAKIGDSVRGYMLCEATLCVKNEKAHGAVADLTTSA